MKTTIFGAIAALAVNIAPSLDGMPKLIVTIIGTVAGILFGYHATDKKTN